MRIQTREAVIERDNATCVVCGVKPPPNRIHVHHVVPVSEGGSDQKSNLVTMCLDCHAKAHEDDDNETTARLIRATGTTSKNGIQPYTEERVWRQKLFEGEPCTDPDILICVGCGGDVRIPGYPDNIKDAYPPRCDNPQCATGTRFCVNCGKPHQRNSIYCSHPCLQRMWRIRSGSYRSNGNYIKYRPNYRKWCITCGDEFMTGPIAKYCSGICKTGDQKFARVGKLIAKRSRNREFDADAAMIHAFSDAVKAFAGASKAFEAWCASRMRTRE